MIVGILLIDPASLSEWLHAT